MNPYLLDIEKSNRKDTSAQKAMKESLIKQYSDKGITELGVCKFCNKVPVARTTFYTYYKNMDELLEELENDILIELLDLNSNISSASPEEFITADFLGKTLAYIDENHDLMYAFLVRYPNNRFIENWKQAIKYHFYENLFKDKSSDKEPFLSEVFASECIGAYTFYVKNPGKLDTADFNVYLAKFMAILNE